MRIKAGLALLAVLALVPSAAFAVLRVGDAAPNFTLPDSAGTTHNLTDFRGKVVAILGWANF
jgi:cytochrome oxidase Cu insertion factor (SCO1/SenC/PrrC family)